MEMTRAQLARVSLNLLTTIRENKLTTVDSIKAVMGEAFGDEVDDKHQGEEYVDASVHPRDPSCTVLRYFRRIGQTPIQLMIRPAGCKLMVTCVEPLPGY